MHGKLLALEAHCEKIVCMGTPDNLGVNRMTCDVSSYAHLNVT